MSKLEAPTEVPRRGLSKLGARINRKDKDTDKNSSTSSLVPPQDDGSSGIRASIDGALDKLKDRRRKSSDDKRKSSDERRGSTESTTHSRMSKFPLSRRSRRRASTNEPSPPTTDEPDKSDRGVSPSPSELSFGLAGSGHSSLMTEDSDYDE